MTYLSNMVVDNIRAPEHLLSYSWLELEKDQALRVFTDLENIVGKLDKKLTEKRVHDVRVVLRRWASVWDILAADGWEESNNPDRSFEKNIGRHLRKLVKSLGQLRDLDVSLSLARDLHINKFVVKHLKVERKKLNGKVRKKIKKLKLAKLIARMKIYLADKSYELTTTPQPADSHSNEDNGHSLDLDITVMPDISAYSHLNQFLLQSEHHCRLLCEHDRGNEELHELRLSIKRWRYLLTEFFGLTNIDLVRAQQILGKIRDLNRLNDDIERFNRPLTKAIESERLNAADLKADKELISAAIEKHFALLGPVLEQLPFGLRPYLLSL